MKKPALFGHRLFTHFLRQMYVLTRVVEVLVFIRYAISYKKVSKSTEADKYPKYAKKTYRSIKGFR